MHRWPPKTRITRNWRAKLSRDNLLEPPCLSVTGLKAPLFWKEKHWAQAAQIDDERKTNSTHTYIGEDTKYNRDTVYFQDFELSFLPKLVAHVKK